MRLNSISLNWFRGASNRTTFILEGKSAVVFGENGAGKSSFVDALEATITNGKVGHLSHRYSGHYQEKGIINTKRPAGTATNVDIQLINNSVSSVTWAQNAPSRTNDPDNTIPTWDLRRTALRQEELSDFIRSTKGEKYSTVLPLLGLRPLEILANNLHQLAKSIEKEGNLQALKTSVEFALTAKRENFGNLDKDQLGQEFQRLRDTYAPSGEGSEDQEAIEAVLTEIGRKVETSEKDQQFASAIADVANNELIQSISRSVPHSTRMASFAEENLIERLKVLEAAGRFSEAIPVDSHALVCPACGRDIEAHLFKEHVVSERERLTLAQQAFDSFKLAGNEICNAILQLSTTIEKPILASWKSSLFGEVDDAIKFLATIEVEELRANCNANRIEELNTRLTPLMLKATEASILQPPNTQGLVADKESAKAFLALVKARATIASVKRVEALIRLVQRLQVGVRDKISKQAQDTFGSISQDVQRYWKILQPRDAITDIRLDVPTDADKAIEIYLKFFGKVQDSPLLTLSEGQRNALGLSIFLSMAHRAKKLDTPIVLDDVVISFDRNHRSRVSELLETEFSDRQILLLTHDREWFYELQRTLNRNKWGFTNLKPYVDPSVGIQFLTNSLEFDAARDLARSDPLTGMTACRRIMDVALSKIAETVQLKLPYLQGGKNDHRTAGEFLIALERSIKKSYQLKNDHKYSLDPAAHPKITNAKPTLAIWANRATHTYDGGSQDAEDLINACEEVLGLFTCSECSKNIGHLTSPNKFVQCECGKIRWKHP